MKLTRNSLAFRLLLSVILWIGIVTICTGMLVSGLFRWGLLETVHEEIREHLLELQGLTELEANGQPKLARGLSDPRYYPVGSGYYWQIERPGFRTLASHSLGDARLGDALARSHSLSFGWQRGPMGEALVGAMIVPQTDGRPPLRVVMATDRRLVEETMGRFNRALFWTLTGIGLVMLLGGLWHVGFTLVPLRRLSGAISDIRQGRTDRMEGHFPAEVQPLVDDLNDLLQTREERAVHHRLRASNLAHGLRTPLTILMGEADRLSADGHSDAAKVIMREAERMSRHVDYHLARARAAIDQPKLSVEASLTDALAQLVPAMTRLYQSRGIAFVIEGKEAVMLRCDAADLLEMLSNLLDNAGKWAATACHVDWHLADGMCRIFIRDDGPGVEPEIARQLFAPGERLDDTQPGSGLGLAITRELAAHYGGGVSLEGAPGKGCTATLTLPRAKRAVND
jgi:signal transduction histidine kinase